MSHVTRHIALVLSGAILIGCGWGAALGLAVLAAASIYAEQRKNRDTDASST